MASLIQQRMAIDRQRILGTFYIIIGAMFLALAVADLAAKNWPGGFFLVLGIFWLISGLVNRTRSKRSLRAFEAEHGVDAGRQ